MNYIDLILFTPNDQMLCKIPQASVGSVNASTCALIITVGVLNNLESAPEIRATKAPKLRSRIPAEVLQKI